MWLFSASSLGLVTATHHCINHGPWQKVLCRHSVWMFCKTSAMQRICLQLFRLGVGFFYFWMSGFRSCPTYQIVVCQTTVKTERARLSSTHLCHRISYKSSCCNGNHDNRELYNTCATSAISPRQQMVPPKLLDTVSLFFYSLRVTPILIYSAKS